MGGESGCYWVRRSGSNVSTGVHARVAPQWSSRRGEVSDERDREPFELVLGADPGTHEDCRREVGACGQHDRLRLVGPAVGIFDDAGSAFVTDDDAVHERVPTNREIRVSRSRRGR